MRILVDTNILFSALLFPRSKPAQALLHAAEHPKYMTAAQFFESEGLEGQPVAFHRKSTLAKLQLLKNASI